MNLSHYQKKREERSAIGQDTSTYPVPVTATILLAVGEVTVAVSLKGKKRQVGSPVSADCSETGQNSLSYTSRSQNRGESA